MIEDALEAVAYHTGKSGDAVAAVSTAVSLKRIADALDVLTKPPTIVANNLSPDQMSRLGELARQSSGVLIIGDDPLKIVRKQPINITIETISEGRLEDRPPWLYLHGDTLICKTEYWTTIPGGRKPDCYIVETGEYFCGGVPDHEIRSLLVKPVTFKLP